ncbi:hypothetical protein DQD26_22645 [Salmonella enterica subsp. enterica serovar Ibadan]|nr:hypothetical protein [Salmonella enterica subsp. enterica serovar Ibadan]
MINDAKIKKYVQSSNNTSLIFKYDQIESTRSLIKGYQEMLKREYDELLVLIATHAVEKI